MSDEPNLPEASGQCPSCGWEVYFPAGQKFGHCYNDECTAIVKRPNSQP